MLGPAIHRDKSQDIRKRPLILFLLYLPTLSKSQHAYLVGVLLEEGVTLLCPLPADRQAVQLPPNRPLPDMAAPMASGTPTACPPVDKYVSTLDMGVFYGRALA